MEKMTVDEMIVFLRGMNQKKMLLEKEKQELRSSVETLEEAIRRNNFARKADGSGIVSRGFSPDKVLRVLLNSERDIEEETKSMVQRMQDIYKEEDRINFVKSCLLQIPVREQQLINEFYINDTAIITLSNKTNHSASYLYRLIKRGIRDLLAIYNGNCESADYHKADRLIHELSPYMSGGPAYE